MTLLADPTRTITRYEDHEPVASPEVRDKASKKLADADFNLATSNSRLGMYISSLLRTVHTSVIDTMAVTILPDGFAAQLINSEFVAAQPKMSLEFGRIHEIYHLIFRHLNTDTEFSNREAWTLAQEVVINTFVCRVFGLQDPPKIIIDGKEASVIEPRRVHRAYSDKLREIGEQPVSYERFAQSDMGCYLELCRLPKLPRFRATTCVLANEGGTDSDGEEAPIDSGELGTVVEQGLAQAINAAQRSGADSEISKELKNLISGFTDNERASQMFSDLGAGFLRIAGLHPRKVSFWQQFLDTALNERLRPGERLKYNEKVWWDPRLSYRGEEAYRRVLVAVDASGSMRTSDLRFIADKLGEEENLEFSFLSFDAEVAPFALDGGGITGGGGTSFQVVADYVDAAEEDYDAVVVVTDGYAPHITPADPDRWVWLIVPGGDPWPAVHTAPMTTIEIDTAA